MSRIELTHERLKELLSFDDETGRFKWIARRGHMTAGMAAGSLHKDGYYRVAIDKKSYLLHRLAWLYVYGSWPSNVLDHINGIRTDNRIENLRDVTQTENKQNTKKANRRNKVGLQGVSQDGNKFWSRIKNNGKFTYLGRYETPELAHQAFLKAKREMHSTCTI